MTSTRPGRPSMRAQRDVALLQLGLDPATAELDHNPALGLRKRTEDGGYDPPANDLRSMKWMAPADHDRKTFGTKATTAGSDIHLIAKDKRLQRDEAAHQAIMAISPPPQVWDEDNQKFVDADSFLQNKETGESLAWNEDVRRRQEAKHKKMQSRGFDKTKTRGFDGRVRPRKEAHRGRKDED